MSHALLLAVELAGAHAGDRVDAIDLVPGPGGHAIELSVGLVIPDGDTAAWVCHEAITAPDAIQAPRYLQGSDGSWFAFLRDPAQGRGGSAGWHSAEGCSWTASVGLGDLGVLEAAIDPLDPAHVLALTRDPSGQTALYEGLGGSFAPVLELAGAPTGVRFGPDGSAWVGVLADQPQLWRRAPGEPWQVLPLGEHTPDPARVVAIAGDPERLWVAADGPEGDTVLSTDDGGQSFGAALPLDGQLIDASWDGGDGAWFIVNGDTLVHGPEGTRIAQRGIGIAWIDGELWCTSHPEVTGWLAGTFDGVEPAPRWFPADVAGPLDCPADSDVARVCAPLWPELGDRLAGEAPGGLPDSGLPADDRVELAPRCGCDAGGRGGWALLAALVLLCRRR